MTVTQVVSNIGIILYKTLVKFVILHCHQQFMKMLFIPTSVSGTGRVFSSLVQSNKQVIHNWQRNMFVFDKNIHTGVKPFVWKGETIPKSLLSGQRTQPPCSMRYASTEDDIVCYSDLKRLKKSGKVLVIDVRGKDETWRTGTIPGSLCIPLPELESALKMPPETFEKNYCREKPNSNDEIVFVCRRGERSYKAMKQARIMGYEKSKSYQGGFMGWFDQERIIRERKDKPNNK